MTLQASGQIRVSEINTELGDGASTAINLGAAIPRLLSRTDGGGEIQLSDFYSKSSTEYSITFDEDTGTANIFGYSDAGDGCSLMSLSTDSLSPTTLQGDTIEFVQDDQRGGFLDFIFKLDNVQVAANYFYALTLNSNTFKSADATHTQTPSGSCQGTDWTWSSNAGVTDTSYTMNIYW